MDCTRVFTLINEVGYLLVNLPQFIRLSFFEIRTLGCKQSFQICVEFHFISIKRTLAVCLCENANRPTRQQHYQVFFHKSFCPIYTMWSIHDCSLTSILAEADVG